MIWRLALRNLSRSLRRTILTVSAMAVANCLLIFTLSLNDGILWSMILSATEQYRGHLRLLPPLALEDPDLHHTLPLKNFDTADIVFAPRLRGMFLVSNSNSADHRSIPAEFIGVDPASDPSVTSLLATTTPDHGVLLGSELMHWLKVSPGDEIVIMGQGAFGAMASALLKVQGPISSGDKTRDSRLAVLHIKELGKIMDLPDQAHEYVGRCHDVINISESVTTVRQTLNQWLVRSWRDDVPQLAAAVDYWFLGQSILMFIFYSAVLLIVTNAMTVAVIERTREFAVMRALGLYRHRLIHIILTEGLILGLVSASIGAILGIVLSVWLYYYPIDLTPWFGEINWGSLGLRPAIRTWPQVQTVLWPSLFMICLGPLAALTPAWQVMNKPLARTLGEK